MKKYNFWVLRPQLILHSCFFLALSCWLSICICSWSCVMFLSSPVKILSEPNEVHFSWHIQIGSCLLILSIHFSWFSCQDDFDISNDIALGFWSTLLLIESRNTWRLRSIDLFKTSCRLRQGVHPNTFSMRSSLCFWWGWVAGTWGRVYLCWRSYFWCFSSTSNISYHQQTYSVPAFWDE